MVTWGANTVQYISPAPAPSGAFGSAPAPAQKGGVFGSTAAPAPTTGGFFGSSTAPAPTGSLFGGTPSPSSGGLFGSTSGFGTPAPSPSLFGGASGGTSLFGATPAPTPSVFGTSSNLFGAPSSSPFGSPGLQQQQQQQQQPQIPAQAALHAHMEASNRQEAERVKSALEKLHAVYSGTSTPSTTEPKTKFVSIVYNDLTQEHRQLQWLHGMSAGGKILPVAPPKPPQISEEEWNKAVVQNPDPLSYMPIPLVGADALNARVSWQQERATQLAKDAKSVQNCHETVQELYSQAHKRLEDIQRAHSNQRKRLLNVMRKVEVVRCMNQSLQPDEVRVKERLRDLDKQVREVRRLLAELEGPARAARSATAAAASVQLPDREQLSKVLTTHREELTKLTVTMQKDIRDVALMKQRVVPQLEAPPSRPALR
jgi:hypothetical protein